MGQRIIQRKEKLGLIILSGLLFLVVLGSFATDAIYEYNDNVISVQKEKIQHTDPEHYIGFSRNYSRRFIAGLNIAALPLLISFIMAKKYYVSFAITLLYLGLGIYSIWLHLSGCFLGEDLCPPQSLWGRLSERTDWFELYALLTLITLLVWHIAIFVRTFRARSGLQGSMP